MCVCVCVCVCCKMKKQTLFFFCILAFFVLFCLFLDTAILKWCDSMISGVTNPLSDASKQITTWENPILSNCLYFLDLVSTIDETAIKKNLIRNPCLTMDDKLNNARYVMSVVRKLGGYFFITPEALVAIPIDGRVMAQFAACIMTVYLAQNTGVLLFFFLFFFFFLHFSFCLWVVSF